VTVVVPAWGVGHEEDFMRGWMVSGVVGLGFVLGAVPAMAGKTAHFERSVAAGNIGVVQVDVSFHDVRVEVAPGDTIRVTVDLKGKSEKLLDEAKPKIEVDGKILKITAKRHHHFGWGSGSVSGKVSIEMPPGRELDVDTASGDCQVDGDLGSADLDVDTASGDVAVDGAFEQGEIDTASGEARLKLRRPAGALEVQTASGDVAVDGEVAKFKAGTASGDVRANGLKGAAEVDTASGDVVLRWAGMPSGTTADIETASGDVRITLPAGAAVTGMVTTYSGDIVSDFPGTRKGHGRALELQANNPALRLEISTASGDVALRTSGS